MEFKGRIYRLFPVQSGTSAKGTDWQKQDFIFEYFEHDTDRWSDKVLLSIMNDRIRECDLHEGDEVIVGFGHSVREYQGRYFNDVRLYKLEKASKAMPANAPTVSPQAAQQAKAAEVVQQSTEAKNNAQDEDDGILPF